MSENDDVDPALGYPTVIDNEIYFEGKLMEPFRFSRLQEEYNPHREFFKRILWYSDTSCSLRFRNHDAAREALSAFSETKSDLSDGDIHKLIL